MSENLVALKMDVKLQFAAIIMGLCLMQSTMAKSLASYYTEPVKTCDIVTRAKDAIFSNPPLTSKSTGLECSYNVEINNPRICQIRIDYDILTLSQPTLNGSRKASDVSSNTFGFACRDDLLEVTNLQAFSEIIPTICGENGGQHVYLRVNPSLDKRALLIKLKIADRTLRTNLPIPSWKIRITQLECHDAAGLQNRPSYLEPFTNYPMIPLMNGSQINGQTAQPIEDEGELIPEILNVRQKRDVGTAANDNYLIAPPGCLQYYPDRAGTFESFNYNSGRGRYLANLRYATCFRRSIDVCGIKYTPSFFRMTNVASANNFLDTDCEKNPYVINNQESQDFLFIADGQTADGRRGSKWCGTSAANSIVASSPPGPLYVFFNSDNFANNPARERGYKINYNVLNNC